MNDQTRDHKAEGAAQEEAASWHPEAEILSAIADGEPASPEIAAHVADCEECRASIDAYRKLGVVISRHFAQGAVRRTRECPSDEDLAGYLDDTLDVRSRDVIEAHVRGCDWCLRELAETRRLLSAGPRSPAESTGETPSRSPVAEVRGAGASTGSVRAQTKETKMESVTCAACATANAAGSKFCRECGASLASDTFDCIHCGAALAEGSRFCNQCGRAVVAKTDVPSELRTAVQEWLPESVRENKWLVGAIVAVLASFAFPAVFLQFLLAAGIMGGAWLLQKAKREMLGDLYRAWKSGDDVERDRLLSRLKSMIHRE